jgi:hypothetical protein
MFKNLQVGVYSLRVVGPYTLSNLCQRLYAKNLGKVRLLKGNLI